jgi:hypothetical protein
MNGLSTERVFSKTYSDRIVSLVASGRLTAVGWDTVALSKNFIEISEILIYSPTSNALIAFAITPSPPLSAFSLAGGLDQVGVIISGTCLAGIHTRIILSTAVTNKDSIYIYTDQTINYRISGKVVTQ